MQRLRYHLDTESQHYIHSVTTQEGLVGGKSFHSHSALLDCTEFLLESMPRPFMDLVDQFQEYCQSVSLGFMKQVGCADVICCHYSWY